MRGKKTETTHTNGESSGIRFEEIRRKPERKEVANLQPIGQSFKAPASD